MIRGLMSIKISSLIGIDRVLCLTPASSITTGLLYHLNEKYHWSEPMGSAKNSKQENQLTRHFVFGSVRSPYNLQFFLFLTTELFSVFKIFPSMRRWISASPGQLINLHQLCIFLFTDDLE